MKRIEPKTDNDLEWVNDQWVLTKAFIKRHYDIAYKDDQTLDRRRLKNTRVVYSVILSRVAQVNVPLAKWVLGNTQEGKTFMRDILAEQMEADLLYGYNDLGLTSAVNVANGQTIDRKEIEKNLLCPNSEMMVEGSTNYFPFNLFMQYQYPWNIANLILAMKG